MSEQENPVETTTPQPEGEKPEAAAPKTAEELQAELERTQAALKNANKESAERRKRLEALEKAETDRKAAEMSEIDRLKLEAEQAKAALIEARKLAIGAKHALPELLASRLKGETIEELEADALALLETLPKKPAAQPPSNPTNPGNGAAPKETDAERRRRLFGG